MNETLPAAAAVPRLLVFNKIDRVGGAVAEQDATRALLARWPDAIVISARRPADVAALRARLCAFFARDLIEGEVGARASAALAPGAGVDPPAVLVAGRDVTLSGVVASPDAAARAVKAVDAADGDEVTDASVRGKLAQLAGALKV